MAELQQLTRGALAEMRTLLLELRPVGLAEARLEDLIKQLAEGLSGRIRVPVDVHLEGQAELPPDVKISFYRIAQEALNNLAKHSGANKVEIGLRSISAPRRKGRKKAAKGSQSVSLVIQDNGSGFDVDTVPSDHMGLGIMRERAGSADAALSIQSKPGEGTIISLTWPRPVEEKRG
jgi:signal transduction histidine kinase